jgi:hypothetical protein
MADTADVLDVQPASASAPASESSSPGADLLLGRDSSDNPGVPPDDADPESRRLLHELVLRALL